MTHGITFWRSALPKDTKTPKDYVPYLFELHFAHGLCKSVYVEKKATVIKGSNLDCKEA